MIKFDVKIKCDKYLEIEGVYTPAPEGRHRVACQSGQ
jgi:hypothetical protein